MNIGKFSFFILLLIFLLGTSSHIASTAEFNDGTGINNISAGNPGVSAATITWTTDEPATSQIEYGPTSFYTTTVTVSSVPTTNHSVKLLSLAGGNTYHFRIRAVDSSGNTYTSPDQTFTTNAGTGAMTIAPSSSWNGTFNSAGTAPTNPTRTTFKPIARFTIVPYQDVTEDFDVPVMAFAKGGIEKVRFYVEGNTVDVTSPIRYAGHQGRPYEAYVVTLDQSLFPAKDGGFRVYAEVFPNDPIAQNRVISIDLYHNGGGTLSGSGIVAYVDSRATLTLGSPMTVTAGNRLIGSTTRTMAIVVESATPGTSLVVSPISMDGGVTQPAFTDGETIIEVMPNGTPTGNTSTVSGSLSYYGTSGTYPSVGTSVSPFWHLKAAATALQSAGHPTYVRVRYLFKNGSYHLFGTQTGVQNNYQYVHFEAAPGSTPTFDYGLFNFRYLSYVDQHIKGFVFRKPHTFTGSDTYVNIGAGLDTERYWLDNVTFEADAANVPVMAGPGNGGADYSTDSTVRNASASLAGGLVRNANIYNSSHDSFSHSPAVINSSANNMNQIYPSHTDIYQYEVASPAENILIYGLKVINPVVINAGLFLTGEAGSTPSFRDVAIINYLSEAHRDDLHLDFSHVLIWNTTTFSNFTVGTRPRDVTSNSSIVGNWFNYLYFVPGDSTAVQAGTTFDSNNYAVVNSAAPGTNATTLSVGTTFTAPGSDYTPKDSMPTAHRLTLLDVEGNYRAVTTAIGATAKPSEYNGTMPPPPPPPVSTPTPTPTPTPNSTPTPTPLPLTLTPIPTPNLSPVYGSCGNDNNTCYKGIPNNLADSATHYLWQCLGERGGTSAQCSINMNQIPIVDPKINPTVPVPGQINGYCGPSVNRCISGTFRDSPDSGVYSYWSCMGQNGGSNINCTTPKQTTYPTSNNKGVSPANQLTQSQNRLAQNVLSPKVSNTSISLIPVTLPTRTFFTRSGMKELDIEALRKFLDTKGFPAIVSSFFEKLIFYWSVLYP